MDDVWSTDAWDDFKVCFPDDRNGSRVLVTTRLEEVANYASSKDDFSHQMHLLDQSESWNLFREKACKSRGAEFEMFGKPIVEKCQGLPLAIIVAAGLFSKLNTLDEWKNTVKALNSSATTAIDEECSRILSLSYIHLPHKLKACFLYLGVFPEDKVILSSRLARLWAAEGLVKTFKNESFKVMARKYIQELMDRNLILVSQLSSCGRRIKAFRMHDLLHSFCEREAQNESLLHVIRENVFNLPQKGSRWVSIQSENFDDHKLCSSSLYNRSILDFPYMRRTLNLKIFSLLRVVHGTVNKVSNLLHLRCLVGSAHDNFLKPFCAWNLQSLEIEEGDEGNCFELPRLQFFECPRICCDPPKFVHRNLESISWLDTYQCTKKFFTNFPYLKKVRIESRRRDWNDFIENLDDLRQLESLRIRGVRPRFPLRQHVIPINDHIVRLKNLEKLTLDSIKFEWKGINVLSELPGLEALTLIDCACVGEEWELLEEEFGRLIYLGLGSPDLKHWKASADHFPKLERLCLSWCEKLEEIPAGFADLPKLKSIRLHKCLPAAVTSARRIEQEQRDFGNNNMVVIEENTIRPDDSSEDESDDLE